MNESTVLDFVELRLCSPSSSRCELHISAEDRTEKLACGFLKTFLSHVRAAQELYAAGAGPTLRLEGPQVFNGSRRPWFTKGTLERFIQYVSTPEVLERVKTIEDELIQLEQVRSIQAGNLPQVHDTFLNTDPTVLRAGLVPPEYHVEHYPYSNADNSKRELLRAMDVRLSALHQEQNMAFCRATAAGFDVDNIEDLRAFSEFFGADHLRVACNWFYELYLKRERAAEKPVQYRSQELKNQPSLPSEEMERGASSRASHMDGFDDASGVRKPVMDDIASNCPSPPDELSPVKPHGHVSKGLPQRTSPRRRSASPLKKVQVGRFGSRRAGSVVIRSINYFSDRQSKERNQAMDTSSSDSEDNARSYVLDEPSYAMRSSPAAARRLSVQAAINLFESKQSKEVGEGQGKQRSAKPQSRRGSLDGANSSILGTFDIKHHGEEDGEFGSLGWHERGVAKPAQELDFSSEGCGARIDPIPRSPIKCGEQVATRIDPEEVSFHQEGRQQSGKQASLLKAGLNLRRGSSTSEDFVTSELDSVGGSPIAGRMLEPADSDFSNARSTITSISLSEVYTEKNMPVDSKLYQSTPTSLASSVPVTLYDTQGPVSQKLYRAASVIDSGSNYRGKDSASRDCIMPSDLSIQALASLAHSPSTSEETSGTHEGRFYEHYRKLRDAKMMEEQQSKRAEREAKLRLMEETLDLRKAEMDARTAKLSKDSSHAKTRAAKLLALKANLRDIQRAQEDGVIGNSKIQASSMKDNSRSDSSPPSPPLTPRVVKEQALTPNLHRAKKAVATSQKSATTPRSSTRAVSVSPKTTPRGNSGKVSSQRTPASSNVSENSLACSVPCFSDLKKENSKPSPGKSLGSAHVHSKNGGAVAQPPATNRASLLEANGSVPLQNSSSNRTTRVDKKNRERQARQSLAPRELKDLAPAPEDEVSLLINIQKDVKMEAPVISKIRRSAVAPIQEARPFLRKGTGIGPGAGPGVMKLKAEAVKSSDEDAPGTPLKASDEEAPAVAMNITDTIQGESIPVEGTGADVSSYPLLYVSEDKTVEGQAPELSDADVTHHSDGGFFALCEEGRPAEPYRDDELFENERACHTISFPIDFGIHERYAATFAPEADSAPQAPREGVARREGEVSATLSQLLLESASTVVLNEPSVNGSASFRANLATEENNASRFSPMKAASLASSSLKRLGAAIPDYFSPSSAATIVDSPVGSPASWNSSQVQYASESDATRTQKKLVSSHKPVVVIVPPKEPARGFKRLLKFGRKSRAAQEIIITDGVSASTPSEGDDDMEEVHKEVNMHSAHDVLRKVKLQERLFKDYGIANANGINASNVDKGPVQSLQTSIPSNFQLKYDHAPGGSKLKAPRSFFSLSTFRSRGGEGKSR